MLYIVPLLALAVVVVQVIGWRANSLTVMQALAAITIPIAVPMIFYALLGAELPQQTRQYFPDMLNLFNFSFTGIGFWVMVLAGVLQLLNVMGLFRRGPRDLFGGMAVAGAGPSSPPRRGPPPQYNEPRQERPRYDEPPPSAPRPGSGNRRPPPSRDRL